MIHATYESRGQLVFSVYLRGSSSVKASASGYITSVITACDTVKLREVPKANATKQASKDSLWPG